MKKLLIFIFVLASACMVSCKQNNVETSTEQVVLSEDQQIHNTPIITKDGVEYNIGVVEWDRNTSGDVYFNVAKATEIVLKDYKSSDIVSNREVIFNRICNETNKLVGKSDSIKLISITLLYINNKIGPSHIDLYY